MTPDPEEGQVWRVGGREATILAVRPTHVVLQYSTKVARVERATLEGATYIGEEVKG